MFKTTPQHLRKACKRALEPGKMGSKRKHSFEDDIWKKKKIRFNQREEEINLDNVINLGMPHIGEQIFESLSTDELLQCAKVSQTWKVLAESVLFMFNWKGRNCEITFGKVQF